jgi:hypothetical protein
VISRDVTGESFVGEHETVAHDLRCDVKYVLGKYVVAVADHRKRPSGGNQAQAGSRTGTVGDHRGKVCQAKSTGVARCQSKADGVINDVAIDLDVSGSFL